MGCPCNLHGRATSTYLLPFLVQLAQKKPHRGAGNAGCVGNALHSCVRHAKCPSVLFWTGTVTSPITAKVACVYVGVPYVYMCICSGSACLGLNVQFFLFIFFIYKLTFIFTQEYLTWSHSVQSTLLSKAKCYCLASQRTVYKNECLSKTNLCKLFKSILCSSKVFYASFLQ